jgi:cell wall-associated NlpC family hydrolase
MATTPTGAAIAATARRYDGAGYVYGGNASAVGDWDCSSFVSYVLGHDLGMGLPGGVWGGPGMPPAVHGPVVLDYVQWSGATAVPGGQEAAGDLVCWPGVGAGGHIGIVQAVNVMVSALDTQYGTLESPIVGWGPTDQFVFRRVNGTGIMPPPGPSTVGVGSGGWQDVTVALLAGLLVGGGMIVGVLGIAAALAVGGVWAVSRAAKAARP